MIGVCSPLYTSLRLLMILCVCHYWFLSLNKLGVRNTCTDYMPCPLKPESMVDIVFGLWIVRLCIHLFSRTGSSRSHSQTMYSKYKIGLNKLGWFRQTFVCILLEWSQCKYFVYIPMDIKIKTQTAEAFICCLAHASMALVLYCPNLQMALESTSKTFIW